MKLKPLYKNNRLILIGLDSDYNDVHANDSLVVEIDLENKNITGQPCSGQKKLKFSGYFETVSESEAEIITDQIYQVLGLELYNEIVDLLMYPPLESVRSLIWIPDRLKDTNKLTKYRSQKHRYAEFEIDENHIEQEFERIAKLILLKKCLIVNNTKFRFTEIEFYYYCDKHQDAFTHKHAEEATKWRFHNQGIDVTLKGKSGFGGILIRGIERVENSKNDKNRFINGPRRVMFEMMKYLNSIDQLTNEFGIVNCINRDLRIFKTFRHRLNNPDPTLTCNNIEHFKNAPYRFIVNPQYFKRDQFSGKEKIARGFNNEELARNFLGYNLNK